MSTKTVNISLPEEILSLLDDEAAEQTRDRSKQIQHILADRYKKRARLEDKLTAGAMKK
jgi:metal-responsive CopG/Arc/MetJ family transcriptional regulator